MREVHCWVPKCVSVVPCSKVKLVAKMIKAIHAQENKKAARGKAGTVVAQLKNVIEQLDREIHCRLRVMGTSHNGNFALMAGLCPNPTCSRHPAGQKEVHEHEALGVTLEDISVAGLSHLVRVCKPILHITLDSTGKWEMST